MPYIYPNTEIALLKNIPLDNSYEHTLTFNSIAEQVSYFSRNVFRLLSANSYQRALNGRLRIECPMSDAVQCNYLYFRNTSFENKYFYAFITGWEYVNNITTEITYEIDVFQTFFFDLHIQPSFVEREHSNTDSIGENLIPEGLEQGEYILMDSQTIMPTAIEGYVANGACILMLTTFNDDAECTDYTGGFSNYCYSALNVVVKQTLAELNTFLQKTINKKGSLEGIVASYMCPYTPLVNPASYFTWNTTIIKNYTSLNGYIPKNNKLFTSPYYTTRIRTDSDMNDFPYEYFSGNTCEYDLIGTLIPEPALVLVPKNYKHNGNSNNRRLDYRMSLQGFPQVALSSDVYKVYLAQNAASLKASIEGNAWNTIVSMGKSAVKGDLGNFISEGVDAQIQINNILGKWEDIKIKPPTLNGTQSILNDYAVGAKVFYIDFLSIRAEFARIIDDYFTMFGYATHRVKTPNITGRPHWNFVKTKGIVLDVANAPQPYIQKIQDCFNRGITFWHNPAEVGNYSLDNRPV